MLTVPFLMTSHHHPMAAYYQEWFACLLGLLAMIYLGKSEFSGRLEIPEISLLPLGLAVIALAQYGLLQDMDFSKILVFALYLIWAALLAILGRQLVRTIGIDALALWLASALLIGALLQSLTAALQINGLIGMPWVFFTNTHQIGGNIGQSNNFGNYVWLGIAAALYLRSQNKIGTLPASLAIFTFTSLTILSGSRTIWLYAIALVVLSIGAVYKLPQKKELRQIQRWSMVVLLCCLSVHWLISSGIIDLLASHSGQSAGNRLMSSGGSDPARMAIWRGALLMWQDHPFFGVGVGRLTPEFFLRILEIPPNNLSAMPEHAHNLFLHLLAETGICGAALLVVSGLRWAWPILRQQWQAAHWFVLAVLLIQFVHSNVEYPLWYGFFLGPTALLAGAISTRNTACQPGRYLQPALAVILLLAATSLFKLGNDYKQLEETIRSGMMMEGAVEEGRSAPQLETIGKSVYAPYLDIIASASQSENMDHLDQKLGHCLRAMGLQPMRRASFKCTHLLVLAGRHDEAKLLLKRAVTAFPYHAEFVLWQWKRRATKEPGIDWLLREWPKTGLAAPGAPKSPQLGLDHGYRHP